MRPPLGPDTGNQEDRVRHRLTQGDEPFGGRRTDHSTDVAEAGTSDTAGSEASDDCRRPEAD